jgi:TRAP-type C4-dicarboxylate transport system permease small subunit
MRGFFAMMQPLERALIALAALFALLMMVHVSADLLIRYVIGVQLEGTIEIVSAYYMVGLVFFPLAMIDRNRGHISADVFTTLMSPRVKAACHRLVDLIIFACMAALLYFSTREAWHKTLDGEMWRSGEFLIPVWPSRWFVPVGALGMSLSVLGRIVGREPSPASSTEEPST